MRRYCPILPPSLPQGKGPGDYRSGTRARVAALVAVLSVLAVLPAFPSRSRAATGFPLVLADDRGATVRLAAPPRRIVSLAPSLTETVFFLGRGAALVGVTRYCDHPPEANRVPKVGGIVDPDVERIVAASPDLVLCTTDGNPKEKVKALEAMGIPCFATQPQDLSGIFRTIGRIGTVLGIPDEARRRTEALRRRAAAASRKPSARPPGVLFVVSTSPVIAAGKGTFLDELIRLSGGRNAAAGYAGRYPRLPVEGLLALSPDVVLVASMDGVERFPDAVTRWKEVPAFRDGAVHYLDGNILTRPGPRMVDALEAVARILDGWRDRHPQGRAR